MFDRAKVNILDMRMSVKSVLSTLHCPLVTALASVSRSFQAPVPAGPPTLGPSGRRDSAATSLLVVHAGQVAGSAVHWAQASTQCAWS